MSRVFGHTDAKIGALESGKKPTQTSAQSPVVFADMWSVAAAASCDLFKMKRSIFHECIL